MAYCGKYLRDNLPSVSFSFPFFSEMRRSKSESSIVQVIINVRHGEIKAKEREKRIGGRR
jgi:hypothetical protein